MKESYYAFGIDIGGTNTKIGFFDQQGSLIAYRRIPTDKSISAEDFINKVAQESFEIIAPHGFSKGDKRIIGLGAGAPTANFFTGFVSNAPNLGWVNIPLKDHFEKYFGIPSIIENDANLAALGEKRWGSGKDFSDFVLVTLGTGVGTGIVLNHKLFRGFEASGAEGGHVIIPHTKNRKCSCGGMDHLESYLSARGIKKTITEVTGESWSIEHLGELLTKDDPRALEVIEVLSKELALGLTSMAVVLGPQAFILGGGVSKLGPKFHAKIQVELDELVHFSLKGKIKVFGASSTTDKGAIHGGAAHAFDQVMK